MKVRNLAIFFLLATLSLNLTCAEKETREDQPKKLRTYGRYWTGVLEFMKGVAIPEFKKETGLDIEIITYTKTTETLERVEIETISDKKTADFIWIDLADINAYIKKDLLTDLTDIVAPFANQIPKKFLEACRGPDGKIYAIPHQVSIDLMIYNENNINVEDLPTTYDELLEWCKANPDKYSYRGIGEHLTTSLMNVFYAFGAYREGQDLAQFFNSEINPPIIDVFEYLVKLNKYTKKPLYTDYGTMELEMANELLWLYSIWDSNVVRIRKNKKASHVRLHPVYNLTGPTGKKAICLGGWLFAVPKNAANPELGKKFLAWAMSEEMQIKSIGDSTKAYCGHIPARMDATEHMPDFMKEWFDVKDVRSLRDNAFQSLVARPTELSYYFDLSTLVQQAHDEIVIQGKPIETVLENVQAQLDLMVEASKYIP